MSSTHKVRAKKVSDDVKKCFKSLKKVKGKKAGEYGVNRKQNECNMNVEKDLFCLGMEKMVGLGNQENGIRRKEVVEDLIFSTQLQEERTSGLGDIGADA
ncbi:hypothetical protein RUM44_000490 [Polyplax serrata]|uniref:Uncharacterized protein n=1 Tax=Polyplax serrata TaxID=468196 RepID=A0ABR1B5L7_POLSC